MSEDLSTIISNVNNTEHRGALTKLFTAILGLATDSRNGNLHVAGSNHLGIDSIKFNIDPNVTTHEEGQMHWDAGNNTLSLGMIGGTVELQIGQEHFIYAFNQTGSSIPNGAAVYINDAGDQKPRIALADADDTDPVPEAIVVGLATELIAHGESGFVTTQGLVRDLDTTGITEGVPLWLSPTNPGEWQETRPTAPDVNVSIGYCIYAHNKNGIILVSPIVIPRVVGLSDVFGTPSNGDTIRWNSTNRRFEFGV